MKKVILFILLIFPLITLCQTIPTLPPGTISYGNTVFLSPQAKVLVGIPAKQYRYLATTRYVDSLLAALAPVVPTLNQVLNAGNKSPLPIYIGSVYNSPTDFEGIRMSASGGFSDLENGYSGRISNNIRMHPFNGTDVNFDYSNTIKGGLNLGLNIDNNAVIASFTDLNSGYINVRGKDPLNPDDFVTKRYSDSHSSAGNLQSVTNGSGNNLTNNVLSVSGANNLNPAIDAISVLYTSSEAGLLNITGGKPVGSVALRPDFSSLVYQDNSVSPVISSLIQLRPESPSISGAFINKRVQISPALNSNEAVTLSQAQGLIPTFANGLRLQGTTAKLGLDLTTLGTTNIGALTETTYLAYGNLATQNIRLLGIGDHAVNFLASSNGGLENSGFNAYDNGDITMASRVAGIQQSIEFKAQTVGGDHIMSVYDAQSSTGLVYSDQLANDYGVKGELLDGWIPSWKSVKKIVNGRNLQSITTGAGNNVTTNAMVFAGADQLSTGTDGLAVFSSAGTAGLYNIKSTAVTSYIGMDDPTQGAIVFNPNGTANTFGFRLLKTTASTDLIAGFNGRVKGIDAVNSDEFTTKGQVSSAITAAVPTNFVTTNTSQTGGLTGQKVWADSHTFRSGIQVTPGGSGVTATDITNSTVQIVEGTSDNVIGMSVDPTNGSTLYFSNQSTGLGTSLRQPVSPTILANVIMPNKNGTLAVVTDIADYADALTIKDTTSTSYTKALLNSTYPTAQIRTRVVQESTGMVYEKYAANSWFSTNVTILP